MKKYECIIFKNEEIERECGKRINFRNGFILETTDTPDYVEILQNVIGNPIISIRPSGRESWNEVIVLCADGYVKNKKVYLKGNCEYVKQCLLDIFMETNTDEIEIFRYFEYDMSSEDFNKLLKWGEEKFGLEISEFV